MKILHVLGHETRGGAYQAAMSVFRLIGQDKRHQQYLHHADKPTYLQKAWRSTFGFRSRCVEAHLREAWELLKPDLIHLHNFKDYGTAPIYAARKMGIPVVWSCYDYWGLCVRDNYHGLCNPDDGPRLKPCMRCYQPQKPLVLKLPMWGRLRRITAALNELDGIIALSRDSVVRLRMGGVVVPTEVVAVPVTVPEDPKLSVRRGDPVVVIREADIVVFAGWPSEAKGISMFRRLADRPELADLRFQELSGEMDREEVLDTLAHAGCLVVPEQWPNPGPLIISEANVMGVQVVASDIGGIPETMNGMGRLVKHDDEDAFAAAIDETTRRGWKRQLIDLPKREEKTSRGDHTLIRKQIEEAYSDAVRHSSGR